MKNKNLDYYICPKCHNSGDYDITVPGFSIVCDRCGHRDSYVRCKNCGLEGEFVKNISEKPNSWVCDYCNTKNKLTADFYKNPVRIPDIQKTKETKFQKGKGSFLNSSVLIYLILYCFGLVFIVFEDSNSFEIWQSISMFGVASGIFLSLYLGLKLSLYRLNENDKLKVFIEKIHISRSALITHICIIFVALGVATYMDDSTTQSVIKTEKVNSELITAINKKFGRKDITKIVRMDDKYVITFSDGSVEAFKFLENNQ